MNRFLLGHATHPDWRIGVAIAAAQIDAQRERPGVAANPTLGFAYLTEAYAAQADLLLADLRRRWPGVEWVGASGVGVAATGVEYADEPALALMLSDLPPARFQVFSGARPLGGFAAETALVHADPGTPDLAELLVEMSARTASGYLFGGLASGRDAGVQLAGEVLQGGVSGVAFDRRVGLVSRVTQGCRPIGPTRTVTAAERNIVIALDGEPALDVLLRDAGATDAADLRAALPRLRQVLAGLSDAEAPAAGTGSRRGAARHPARGSFDAGRAGGQGAFGVDVCVRHLVGLDPGRRAVAVGGVPSVGGRLAFCVRHVEAARRDLTRICAEVREEVEPEALTPEAALALKAAMHRPDDAARPGDDPAVSTIAGAIYVSCAGRGGAHFGAPSAELAIVRHALGDVPLVGFFAGGEIAHRHLYGYTGVLTVFRGG